MESVERKCKILSETVIDVAKRCRKARAEDKARICDNEDIKLLMQSRKDLSAEGTSAERKVISKSIQKAIQRESRKLQRTKIAKMLHDFTGLKQICGIRANGKRELLPAMNNKHGKSHSERQDIADVFCIIIRRVVYDSQDVLHSRYR